MLLSVFRWLLMPVFGPVSEPLLGRTRKPANTSILAASILSVLLLSACASYSPSLDDQWMAAPETADTLPQRATLEQLVAYAYGHHPRLQSAAEAVQSAQAQITAAGALADPQLSLSQGLTDSGWQTIAIEQEIPLFQRRQIRVSRAELAFKRAQAEYQVALNSVRADVQKALAEYLYVQQRVALQQDVMALYQQSAEAVKSRYESGQAPMAELLRAQNAYDRAQVEALNYDDLLQAARSRLNSSLGRAAQSPMAELADLQQTHQRVAELPGAAEDLHNWLESRSPALHASRYAVYEQQAAQDLADRAGRPRLMVGVEYMNTDMADGMPAAMASISLPIWRSSYRAQRDTASAALRASQAQWHNQLQAAQADLSMALYAWHEAERR